MRRPWTLLALALLAACEATEPAPTQGVTVHSIEGDDPGECSNGADDDANGFFDCDDQGCFNAPDCAGEPGTNPGTGTGTSTGTTTTTGTPGSLADLTAASVNLRIFFDSSLNGLGVCDCYIEWESYALATGVVDDSNPNLGVRVEFEGDWTIVPYYTQPAGTTTTTGGATNPYFGYCQDGVIIQCDPALQSLWPGSSPAYHDFFFDTFDDPPSALKHWVVHEFPGAYIPSDTPSASKQFFITDMWAAYDHAFPVVSYETVESYPLLFDGVYTELDVVFEK